MSAKSTTRAKELLGTFDKAKSSVEDSKHLKQNKSPSKTTNRSPDKVNGTSPTKR
jgi:hypothetical protein